MFLVFLAAFLWGATNPLLKRYSAGFAEAEQNSNNNEQGGVLRDIMFLLKRPKYLITQATNLSGTAVFFYSLQTTDVSIAAVVANALTLAITCIVSAMIGDSVLSLKGILGILLVMIGLGFCTYENELSKTQK
jgi:drug/metabolite transporter (DMT)-like permease